MLAPAPLRLTQADLQARVAAIASRWPTVGLAVGVVSGGGLELFAGHGLADAAAGRPVAPDTIYRVASVTKLITAVAVMQLVERGLVDLDAPVSEYLRAYRLVRADRAWRPATLRHLLTHTAGIRELLHLPDLLRIRDLGETVPAEGPVPTLAEYYRGGLRIDAEPGTRCMYTDHGFSTLGQVVEDVSGRTLARYLREEVFEPLGMTDTDLDRSRLDRGRLATGYELRAHGVEAVGDYEVITKGGGGVSSTPRDLARYLAALLGGGANEHGRILEPATVAAMFAPQYRPDPRIPGVGLAFFRQALGGHLGVEHGGVLPGFDSAVDLAPDDGIAVLAFANGARRGMHWLEPEATRLLRELLGVPEDRVCSDVPQRPEHWAGLCGGYRFSAAPTDPASLSFGLGAQVLVRRGQLHLRFLSAIPALLRGVVLHPDDADDPDVFRAEFPWFGIGTARIVFSRGPDGRVSALHVDVGPMSFQKR